MNGSDFRGLGLSVEPLRIAAMTARHCDGGVAMSPSAAPQGTIPPSVLLPRIASEPLRLDMTYPLHPRGAGGVWPPEAATGVLGDGPRFPIALAWPALSHSASLRWRWTTPAGESHEASPAEAIATAVAACTTEQRDAPLELALVVPNQLRMERQQELIDACHQRARSVKLLWRPIAAALAWCEKFGDEILNSHLGTSSRVGQLLSLHLGLDEFELTVLELVIETRGDRRWLLPARRRPDPTRETLPSFGLDVITRKLNAELWSSLWLTGSIGNILRALRDGQQETVTSVFNRSPNAEWHRSITESGWLPQAETAPADFHHWIRSAVGETSEVVGAVVTGELARVHFDRDSRFWQTALSDLDPAFMSLPLLVQDNSDGSSAVLAHGAAIHALRLAAKEPSYLDTLPRIRTTTYVHGKLTWLDLLQSDDSYVDGGRTWQRPQPLTGLKVQRGRSRVEVTLWHDEFPTIRKVCAEFAQPVVEDVPVSLDVRIAPAQGNARIDVIPTVTNVGVRRLQLEWRRMQDEKLTPEEWLSKQPTLFPPLLPRMATRARWESVKLAMETFLRVESSRAMNRIIERLKQTDQPVDRQPNVEARATAISSDGDPPSGSSPILDEFVARVVLRLRSANSQAVPDLVRVLGYASTPHPEFQRYLADRIVSSESRLLNHELIACGRCLRDPHSIAAFATALLDWLQGQPKSVNVWLQAFAGMLRHREDATRYIASPICEELTSYILAVFERKRLDHNANYIFRYSSLCIVYLLRRRAYDDDYLPPGSPLNTQVREAFERAIADVRAGRMKAIGGAIRLDRVLQTMIDYVDRKGTPGLTWDDGLQALTE